MLMVFGGDFGEQIVIFDFFGGDVHVDTVKKRAGKLFLVVLDLNFGTFTFMCGVAKITTRAGIHGGDQHKIGWIGGFFVGARDGDFLVF